MNLERSSSSRQLQTRLNGWNFAGRREKRRWRRFRAEERATRGGLENFRSLQLERRKLSQEARQLSCREKTSRSPEVCEPRHATNRNPIIHGPPSFAGSRVSLRTSHDRTFLPCFLFLFFFFCSTSRERSSPRGFTCPPSPRGVDFN